MAMRAPGTPCECVGIQHIDPGDAVRLNRRVFRQFDRLRGVEVVKELHKRIGLRQRSRDPMDHHRSLSYYKVHAQEQAPDFYQLCSIFEPALGELFLDPGSAIRSVS
jgi:hypothetical protein